MRVKRGGRSKGQSGNGWVGTAGGTAEGRGSKEQNNEDKSTVDIKSLERSTIWVFMQRITGIRGMVKLVGVKDSYGTLIAVHLIV